MKKIFILTVLSVFAFTTFSEKPPKLPKPKKGQWVETTKPKTIYGEWTWIETDCCGIRHGISTPSSTGDNISLELKSDNTFMEIHTKVNALPRSGILSLSRSEMYDMIQFNDERPARYYVSDNGDTLTISWKYLELQTEKYLRNKK